MEENSVDLEKQPLNSDNINDYNSSDDSIISIYKCKICLDEVDIKRDYPSVVMPCQCTMPVHLACLQSQLKFKNQENCEICKKPYLFNININKPLQTQTNTSSNEIDQISYPTENYHPTDRYTRNDNNYKKSNKYLIIIFIFIIICTGSYFVFG